MNRALIDTDILSYFLKGESTVVKNVENYLDAYDFLEISLISYYEILSGLMHKNAYRQLSLFEEFLSEIIILPPTEKSVKISAQIYAQQRISGKPIDDIDLLIAGIAIENDMTLITNNMRHFAQIPSLKSANWKT
jgi:tRNA(fMet)-specific endonuclease VapC